MSEKFSIPHAIAAIAPDGNLTPSQFRRALIEMTRRRIRPGTGSALEFLQRRTALNEWPDLRPILIGLQWVVVGGVATRAYMPERTTKDLDILVRREEGEQVIERLQRAGYQTISKLAMPGYVTQSSDGVEVDVIFGDYPWLIEALQHPARDPAGFPVLDLPYLVLMKLASSRAQDVGDLSRMLGVATEDTLVEVRKVVAQYAPADSADIESLIYLGRFENRKP